MSDREKTYYRRVNAYLNPDKAIQATMIRLKLHGHRRTLMKSYFSIPNYQCTSDDEVIYFGDFLSQKNILLSSVYMHLCNFETTMHKIS